MDKKSGHNKRYAAIAIKIMEQENFWLRMKDNQIQMNLEHLHGGWTLLWSFCADPNCELCSKVRSKFLETVINKPGGEVVVL